MVFRNDLYSKDLFIGNHFGLEKKIFFTEVFYHLKFESILFLEAGYI